MDTIRLYGVTQGAERTLFAQVLERECLRWIRRLERFAAVLGKDARPARECARLFLENVRLLQQVLEGARTIEPTAIGRSDEAVDVCESTRTRIGEIAAALTEDHWRERIPVPSRMHPELHEPRRRGEIAWLVLKGLMLQGKRFDDRLESAARFRGRIDRLASELGAGDTR